MPQDKNLSRIPLVAIDYSRKDDAVFREAIVDTVNRKLYYKMENGALFDVQNTIKEVTMTAVEDLIKKKAGGITLNASDLNIANGTGRTNIVGGAVYSKASIANTPYLNIVTAEFEDQVYGCYSVMLRIALANIASSNDYIKIEAFHVAGGTSTLLATARIKPSLFSTANTFETFGMMVDFNGSSGMNNPKLVIKISLLSNSTPNTFLFDYVRVAPTYTSLYSLPTT